VVLQLLPVVNFWSDGFQYPVGSDMKSAYATVQVSAAVFAFCSDCRFVPAINSWQLDAFPGQTA